MTHTVENDATCRREVIHRGGRRGPCGYPLPCWRHPEQTSVISPEGGADD